MNVRYEDMPIRIKGFSVSNLQGCYVTVLNSRLTQEQQRNSYLHELKHIKNGDFKRDLNCDGVEAYIRNKII